MNTNQLAGKGMIAVIKMGRWGATKRHKAATDEVNQNNQTDAAKVSVTLTKHPALKEIISIQGYARQTHYSLTLPSVDEGMRIVPAARMHEHSAAMNQFATQIRQVVDLFMRDYAYERLTAPARLGGLYDARQWPDEDIVREKFRFETDYRPIPTQGQWQQWLLDSAKEGREELRERVAIAVRHIADRLAAVNVPGAVCDGRTFRDSVVGNLREILDLAPDLNFMDDKDIADLVREARALAQHDPETLRNSQTLRQEVREKADKVAGMFNL